MPVRRVLVALDPNSGTLSQAEQQGCQCLVTHHPLLFQPLTQVRLDQYPGNLLAKAIRNDIALVVAHTNLDVSREGTNDQLAKLLDLRNPAPLEVNPRWEGEARYRGMGQIGNLSRPVGLDELVERLREIFGRADFRVAGTSAGKIDRVALCTGSGGSLVDLAVSRGAHCYLTGDLKYHEARKAIEAGLVLVDVGHFASERIILEPLARYLESQAKKHELELEVLESTLERDPFTTHYGFA